MKVGEIMYNMCFGVMTPEHYTADKSQTHYDNLNICPSTLLNETTHKCKNCIKDCLLAEQTKPCSVQTKSKELINIGRKRVEVGGCKELNRIKRGE